MITKNKERQAQPARAIGPSILGQTMKRRRMWVLLTLIVTVIVVPTLLLAMKAANSGSIDEGVSTFTVRRDDLVVTVTESGSIKARNTIDIKSEVEGSATILNIVPEGTIITQEDVDNGKILVKLDSSNMEEELTQREIDLASAEASYTEAKEAHEIRIKQNESDITAAELKVKFALMDLKKYLGDTVAEELVASVENSDGDPGNIAELVHDPELGGDALQQLRSLTEDINLKEQTYKLAESTLEWTEKLFEKKYVSQTELEADGLDKDRKEITWKQAQTAKELFMKYEFPKSAEQLLSDYHESKRELDRTYASARSKLAQAKASLKSTESRYRSQQDRLNKTKRQIEFSTIKAPAPGLVTYGSSGEDWGRRMRRGPIEEGGTVIERQTIISLPDTSQMMAAISVHESSVDKVRPGQKATIVMDAFLDRTFSGEVLKVAPLPDQQQGWLSPDLKVYATEVSIDGSYSFLKPGMSAKVEILVERLNYVVIVPVQVVANRRGRKVCYVLTSRGPEERLVQTGSFSNTFVQILDGLEVGEKVLLNPPKITESKIDQPQSEPQAEAGSELQDGTESRPQTEPERRPQPRGEGRTESRRRQQADGESRPEGRQGWPGGGQFELTDEMIDRIMDMMEQMEPEKAQELKQLRQSDPEKFKAELTKHMRQQFERARQGGGRGDWQRQRDDTAQ